MARARKAAAAGDDDVSRAIIALYMSEPFFAHIVQGLPRRIDDTTATAAVALVGDAIELRVSPTFLRTLSKDERTAVIKHEVLHVVLKHLTRDQGRQPLLWNLACDVVVNDLIGRWPLPEGAVTRASFPDLDLPEDATAETVYTKLKALADEGKPPSQSKAPLSAKALEERMTDAEETAVGGHSDHSAWRGRRGASPVGGSLTAGTASGGGMAADALIDGLLTRAADRIGAAAWGSIPSTLRDAVTAARERGRPQVDWKRTLRIFSASAGRTRLVTTTRRESSRYGHASLPGRAIDPRAPIGGRLVAGTKIKRLHALLVAIDTSGSISTEQLQLFFREIDAIWRTGATVVIAACDAAVHNTFDYTGKVPETLVGGGGTAFEPVFVWMNEQRARRFDGVVYLTDGHGPTPTTRPSCKLLWVVTDESGMGEHLPWGRQIRLAGAAGSD
jgi:predicted metal-dependent peptidase